MTMRKFTQEEQAAFSAARANLLGATRNGDATGSTARGYYAAAAFQVQPLAAEGLGTWAVDASWRMFVDPACLPGGAKGWTVQQCADVMEHELNHLLRDHAARMKAIGAQNPGSNIATDCEINDDLDANGFVRSIGVHPSNYGWDEGDTAENYYKKSQEDPNQDQSGGDGDCQDEGSDGGPEGESASQGSPLNGSNCGSGAGGAEVDGEPGDDTSLAPALGKGEQKVAQTQVAQAVKQHERTHGRGTVSAGLARWAEGVLAPATVPWQQVLRSVIRQGVARGRGNVDYTYTRVSRRSVCSPGVALPAMYAPKPTIAAVIDTSGSMSEKMLHEAMSEVEGISRQMGCTRGELVCYAVDSEAASPVEYNGPGSVPLLGGGGTDMCVGIDAAALKRPTVIIVLTDGYTPLPSAPPKGCTLVFAVIEDSGHMSERLRDAMPWAKVVKVGN